MLLDRKRINKWARWVALGLALVFGVSFVGLGVGSGTGLNWSELWTSGSSSQNSGSASAQSPEEQIEQYEAVLADDPDNVEALLGMANQYETLEQPAEAASYLEKVTELEPERVSVYERLGDLYLSPEIRDYQAAVRVLNRVTELEPGNENAFLRLGVAQRGVGNQSAAVMAWNRYLQLAPEGEMAETVRTELEAMESGATTSATSTTTSTSE